MKIWYGVGTEHSMNLVMIGHFADAASAEHAKDLIDQFTTAAKTEQDEKRLEAGEYADRYGEPILALLGSTNVHSLEPNDLQQFLYEADVEHSGNEVVITTDEIEVQAYLKLLLSKGARVEVYSAHDHRGTGHGRPT
jgi:hypothetical protein